MYLTNPVLFYRVVSVSPTVFPMTFSRRVDLPDWSPDKHPSSQRDSRDRIYIRISEEFHPILPIDKLRPCPTISR